MRCKNFLCTYYYKEGKDRCLKLGKDGMLICEKRKAFNRIDKETGSRNYSPLEEKWSIEKERVNHE